MSRTLDTLHTELRQLLDGDRTIFLFSEINEESSERVCRDLLRMASDRRKVTLCLNSPGGNLYDAFAICDMVEHSNRKGSRVEAVVLGCAMSAAVAVLQSAHTRRVGQGARVMLHQAHAIKEDYISQIADSLKDSRDLWNQYLERVAERSVFTPKQLDRKLLGRELYFSAEEAVQVGLADAVL